MSVKFSFNIKDLEKTLKKSIEKDIKEKPEQVLNYHIGDIVQATCPDCGCQEIKIISGGKGTCMQCKHVAKIDINLLWK